MTGKHSPLPWRVDAGEIRASDGSAVVSVSYGPVASDDDLALICRAVNAHADLLAALRPFAEFADKWDAHPISGLHDELYTIHSGDDAGVFRLSDCRAARAARDSVKSFIGLGMTLVSLAFNGFLGGMIWGVGFALIIEDIIHYYRKH